MSHLESNFSILILFFYKTKCCIHCLIFVITSYTRDLYTKEIEAKMVFKKMKLEKIFQNEEFYQHFLVQIISYYSHLLKLLWSIR